MTLPLPRRKHRAPLGAMAQQWLASNGYTAFYFLQIGLRNDPEQAREFWNLHRDDFLIQYAHDRAGHRPPLWWRHDAPEPRQRLGGIGQS